MDNWEIKIVKRMKENRALSVLLVKNFPDGYFRSPQEERTMKAPFRALQVSYCSEISACIAVASFFIYYFSAQGTPTVTISNTIIDGQICQVLSPRRDVVYFSKDHSANAQFASPYLNFSECVSYVSSHEVCKSGNRIDHLSLLGIKNPSNSLFADSGYAAFTPTNVAGLSTTLDVFFGVSSSFPRPDMTQSFFGDEKNWYLYNFKTGTFNEHSGTPTSTLVQDLATNMVYFPSENSLDYDLASSDQYSFSADTINQISSLIGNYYVQIVSIFNGVVLAFKTGGSFSFPIGVAVDSQGDIVVVDTEHSMIRKVNKETGYVENLVELDDISNAVALDGDDNIYYSLSDTLHEVRKFNVSTGVSTVMGSSASPSFYGRLAVAVESSGNVIVAEYESSRVCRIDAVTDVVVDIGTTADPPFSNPTGLAVDSNGLIYVADSGNNDIRVIHSNGTVTGQAAKGSTLLLAPSGVTVSADGDIYFINLMYNYIVKIDAGTGELTSLGKSASPAWNMDYLGGIAVDESGDVYVTDGSGFGGGLRKISSTDGEVTQVGIFSVPEYFTVNRGVVSSFAPFPDFGYIDAMGTCRGIAQDVSVPKCAVAHTVNLNAGKKTVYFELIQYVLGVANFCHILVSFSYENGTFDYDFPLVCQELYIAEPYVYAVVESPANGTRAFLRGGMWQVDFPLGVIDEMVPRGNSPYDKLVLDPETSVLDVTVIPDSSTRYLLMALKQRGMYVHVRYDMWTDEYETTAFATPTHFMVAYSWGVCNGNVTSELIELSGTSSFANSCTEPNGIYYQSPNRYYPIPYKCLGISHSKLLTDCEEIAKEMQILVDDTCPDSIPTVCKTQYNSNPPFTCSVVIYPTALTVLSLSVSNTMALYGLFSAIIAIALKLVYKEYQPTETETALANDDRDVGDLLRETFSLTKANPQDSIQGQDKSLQAEEFHELEYQELSYDLTDNPAPAQDSAIVPREVELGPLTSSALISHTLRTLDYVNPSHLIWPSGSTADDSLRVTAMAVAENKVRVEI